MWRELTVSSVGDTNPENINIEMYLREYELRETYLVRHVSKNYPSFGGTNYTFAKDNSI